MLLTVRLNGREYKVDGRVAAMIAWLLERERRVNYVYNGSIQFNFRGHILKPSLQEFGDDIEVARDSPGKIA